MSLLCRKAGIHTTIQDLGRLGHRRDGINVGGAMDRTAARLANILVGNLDSEAVLEMHFPAGGYLFEADTIFALGGAEFAASLNREPLRNWQLTFAAAGSELRYTAKQKGNWAYLAVAGGFETDAWLGSSSTNLTAKVGGFQGRSILKDDRIKFRCKAGEQLKARLSVSRSLIPVYSIFPTVRLVAGGEFGLLSNESRERLLSEGFKVSNDSNRMGYRLSGEASYLSEPLELVSSAVAYGTIQLLPDGQMIVLMADHQTSGGYPRIGHVITQDLPVLAQLGPGDKVGFELVSMELAERELIRYERELSMLTVGVRLAKL